jgi:hypothetical protein
MKRKEKPTVDLDEDDGMLPENDFSKAVRGYTAYRMGEDAADELAVEGFWRMLGYEVERITEPALRFSKAPDFLLKRQGVAVAVCEVKSMCEFDYSVKVNHQDGTATETQHNWRETNVERVLHQADLARDQLFYWNGDRGLANIFVFVNHDPHTRRESVRQALIEFTGIDGTFWFEAENDVVDSTPVMIASQEGQQRIECIMGLTLDARRVLTSAA